MYKFVLVSFNTSINISNFGFACKLGFPLKNQSSMYAANTALFAYIQKVTTHTSRIQRIFTALDVPQSFLGEHIQIYHFRPEDEVHKKIYNIEPCNNVAVYNKIRNGRMLDQGGM